MKSGEIVLFNVPIYSMPENVFHDKWDKAEQKAREKYAKMGGNKDSVERCVDYEQRGAFRAWEYNQIVGYIKIKLSENDVWFDMFLPSSQCSQYKSPPKTFVFSSKHRYFMKESYMPNTHFRHVRMTNDEIVTDIKAMLDFMIESVKELWANAFVDLRQFNALHSKLDYVGLAREINKD